MSFFRWLALLLLIAIPAAADEGPNRWIPVALPSERALDSLTMTRDGRTLYAVGYDAWRSRDAGSSWQKIDAGNWADIGYAVALLIGDENPDHVLVMGYSGLAQSLDGGDTWKRSRFPFSDPGAGFGASYDSRTIYTASWRFCFTSCSGGGIHRSTDGGTRWSSAGLNGQHVRSVAVALSDTQLAFAVVSDEYGKPLKLMRTRDGGKAWTEVALNATTLRSVTVDPTNPANVYVASTEGLFASRDGGSSWSQLTNTPSVLAIDRYNSSTLYLATTKARLVPVEPPLPPGPPPPPPGPPPIPPGPPPPIPPPTPSPTVYDLVVTRSSDGGQNWTTIVKARVDDITDTTLIGLLVDSQGSSFYAYTSSKIFAYTTVPPRRRAARR